MPRINDHFDYTVNEWTRRPFTEILDALPQDIKSIYDVGANAGGFTHIMRQRYPEAKITCFEPVQANYEVLQRNVGDYADCKQYGIYYGATESHVVSRGDGNDGAIFIEQINAGEPRIFSEEIITLKTFESLKEKPDLIKMDIEGAEENVLAESSLVKTTQYLIIEWHPPTEPITFFKTHLPSHEIVINLENKQFLLHANINSYPDDTTNRATKSVRKPKKTNV